MPWDVPLEGAIYGVPYPPPSGTLKIKEKHKIKTLSYVFRFLKRM